MRYQVAALSRAIQNFLTVPGSLGTVHSVFDHAVNILLNSQRRIIAVTFFRAGRLPYALMLGDTQNVLFPAAGIEVGMQANLIKGSVMQIGHEEPISIDFRQAEIWAPEMAALADPVDTPTFLELLDWSADFISSQARQAGLVPLLNNHRSLSHGSAPENPPADQAIAKLAIPAIIELVRAMDEDDSQALVAAAGRLVGYGIGGTPSGDDLLVGMLAALQRSDNPIARHMRSLLRTTLHECLQDDTTSLLSLTVIRHALAGQFSEKVHEVTRQLMHPTNPEALQTSLSQLLLHGATSGSEMLLGILIGFQMIYRD